MMLLQSSFQFWKICFRAETSNNSVYWQAVSWLRFPVAKALKQQNTENPLFTFICFTCQNNWFLCASSLAVLLMPALQFSILFCFLGGRDIYLGFRFIHHKEQRQQPRKIVHCIPRSWSSKHILIEKDDHPSFSPLACSTSWCIQVFVPLSICVARMQSRFRSCTVWLVWQCSQPCRSQKRLSFPL